MYWELQVTRTVGDNQDGTITAWYSVDSSINLPRAGTGEYIATDAGGQEAPANEPSRAGFVSCTSTTDEGYLRLIMVCVNYGLQRRYE